MLKPGQHMVIGVRAWVDGVLLKSSDEARVPVTDHGLVVGDGVFEAVRVRDGEPFAITRHLNRLARSADRLGIGKPDLGFIREGVAACLAGQDMCLGKIRITVTSGIGPLGSPRGSGDLTYIVLTEEMAAPAVVSSIVTVPWLRNERGALAGIKTISYAENALMVEYAIARGASEAIMANTQGNLCEGTGSNIFYVMNDQILTPTLSSGCLAGITRELSLEWLRPELDVIETDAPLSVLECADEAFLTSTLRDLQAIARIDGRDLVAPGPITQQAQRIWAREAAKCNDP